MHATAQNTNMQPGHWLARVDHGNHPAGCPGAGTVQRFYPIHASLIPVGPYRGCVLVWEKGNHAECFFASGTPPFGADVDIRWAIFDPRTSPPMIHKFAWRINIAEAPQPPCTSTAPPGWQNLFCAGHCWLPDGRLLVVGGDYWAQAFVSCGANPPPNFVGSRIIAVFDPNEVNVNQTHQMINGPGFGRPWTSLHPSPAGNLRLAEARWYPSVALMAPANFGAANPAAYIAIAGGVGTFTGGVAAPDPGDPAFNTHELLRWDLFSGAITRDPRLGSTSTPTLGLFRGPTTPNAGGLSFLYYPRMHFVSRRTGSPGSPDGRLWMAGMAAQSADADVINAPEAWVNTGPTLPLGPGNVLLEESTAVLFPPVTPQSRDLQVVMGGSKQTASHSPTATVTNECYAMLTRNVPPVWLPFPAMIHPRKFANSVLLPDASILVVGGGTGIGHGVPGGGVREAEVFFNGQWMRLSDQYAERTYHSVAILLDDGRVLSAGGDTCPDDAEYEIFEPHYFDGAPLRPSLVGSPPTLLRYGQVSEFQYNVPFGQSVDRIALLRPGSLTHSFDSGQRYEPLTFAHVGNADENRIDVKSPSDPTVFPPGYAMMFLVSSTGVPSVAHWVQVMP